MTIRVLVYFGGNGDLYHVRHEVHDDRNLARTIRDDDPEALRRAEALGIKPGVSNRYTARWLAADEMDIADWEWKGHPGEQAHDPVFVSDLIATAAGGVTGLLAKGSGRHGLMARS